MRKKNKKNILFFIIIFLGVLLVYSIATPIDSNVISKIYYSIRYKKTPYYPNRFIRVEIRVYDEKNLRVEKVAVASNIYHLKEISPQNSKKIYLNLRPGTYTLKWHARYNNLFDQDEKIYKQKFKVNRFNKWVNIVIKGSKSYVK